MQCDVQMSFFFIDVLMKRSSYPPSPVDLGSVCDTPHRAGFSSSALRYACLKTALSFFFFFKRKTKQKKVCLSSEAKASGPYIFFFFYTFMVFFFLVV